MRIAVYHNLPAGGAKRALQELIRQLSSRHEIDVYTLESANHEFADVRPWVISHQVIPFRPIPRLQSPFGRLNEFTRSTDLLRLRTLARHIARLIDAGRYDVAFVHPCRFEQSPSVLRYLQRTPSVYYCQEALRLLYERMPCRPYDDDAIGRRRVLNHLDPFPRLYRRGLRAVDRFNLRSADKVLVNSRFTADTIRRIYGVEATVSYLGVDTTHFTPLGLDRRPFVLSVGSLTRLKGFDFLVEALAHCQPERRPRLVIASNFSVASERTYLEQLSRTRQVELDLVGATGEANLVRLYNESSLVAYAPVREPFGLVPLEAMACATPVVAVADGGIPETVVDGRTGIITDRNPARFASAIARLLADPLSARRCGEEGRVHVARHWTWDRAVARLEAHLARQSIHPSHAEAPKCLP